LEKDREIHALKQQMASMESKFELVYKEMLKAQVTLLHSDLSSDQIHGAYAEAVIALSNPAHTQSKYFKHGFSGGKTPVGVPDNVGYCAIYQTKPLAETECIYGYNSGQQMIHK
jgi:hypothetical protein